jgi:hypothetical protein
MQLYAKVLPAIALALALWAVVEVRGDANRATSENLKRIKANTERIGRIEQTDRNSSRATAYRLCARNMVDRAFAHSSIQRGAGMKAVRRLERVDGIPILDCLPNLEGKGARPMSRSGQRAFVKRWEDGKLSGPELGICPFSEIGLPISSRHC